MMIVLKSRILILTSRGTLGYDETFAQYQQINLISCIIYASLSKLSTFQLRMKS